ncbi:MAG: hydroxymethylbilane synthase [Cryobacterium sp.]|nr:hydroxymethylbilane synthase [Oligoflexia bacterium]
MRLKIRIAARTSDLARIQAYTVGETLEKSVGAEIEYAFRKSLGDLNQSDPLWKMPEKGVFTEDFRADLLSGACDLVVHSWKDLPTETRPETRIAATLPRADMRDLLLFKKSSRDALTGAGLKVVKILSSSPRRAYNLTPFLSEYLPASPDRGHAEIEFLSVRGNVPTRLRKLVEGEADGLIVAKAALDRILETTHPEWAEVRSEIRKTLSQKSWMVLPISANPPAAAQGALAIEVRSDRKDLEEILSQINCASTYSSVTEEREILRGHGGGCHQKIGVAVLPRDYGTVLSLRGLTDRDGELREFQLRANRSENSVPSRVDDVEAGPSRNVLFPLPGAFSPFTRKIVPAQNPGGALWISKAEALPKNWRISSEQIVWTSGLSSWKKLATRGVWVNGSAEGLGESEAARIQTLVGRVVPFTKLGHTDGVQGEFPLLATYELAERSDMANHLGEFSAHLGSVTHFYWMSGSLFDYCAKLNPDIFSAHHSCGPGHTRFRLRERLSAKMEKTIEPRIFSSIDEWRKEFQS